MKNKKEQIEEMASLCAKHECLLDCINDCRKDRKGSKCIRSETCKILYKAGYWKASEVIDEFVAGVIAELNKQKDGTFYSKYDVLTVINRIADEMRKEVENREK